MEGTTSPEYLVVASRTQNEVVWLPKKSHSEVTIAKQTNPHPSWVVRSGTRYGLRVRASHAEDTHAHQRPELEYLPGTTMQTYRVGPLPFCTTRGSLSKVFKAWSWPARPGQPLGQDKEHTGIFWSALSSELPTHWAYQLSHGDVIIAPLTNTKTDKSKVTPATAFEASPNTMRHMVTVQKQKTAEMKEDPWLRKDPWSGESKASRPLSNQQLAQMEQSIQQKVLEAVRDTKKTGDEDEEMDHATETRVSHLEQQIKSMQSNLHQVTQTVATFQQEQNHQNTQMVTEIAAVKHQVEAQQKGMKSFIEQQMETQMGRIEALLNKRAKIAGE